MKKILKWLSIFAAAGTVITLAVTYFLKKDSDISDVDRADDTEDEDFDLDADLQPASREYVSLKKETAAPDEDTEKPSEKTGSEEE